MANEQNLKEPWKKGQSGNPKGKPKGIMNKKTMAKMFLEIEREGVDLDGVKKKMPLRHWLMVKKIKNALGKNDSAINDLFDWADGQPLEDILTKLLANK